MRFFSPRPATRWVDTLVVSSSRGKSHVLHQTSALWWRTLTDHGEHASTRPGASSPPIRTAACFQPDSVKMLTATELSCKIT